ncbi:MAG: type II toxin-antitoxin system HipA family toxin [Rhodothermaceae bacterium]|nr:type II toxin-antitoxin system HipA family toxin [Rhodothermaceae bacterium]MXW33448.1 type II toxin-antitoxin system HipA family toxin [Rhodothermaceae bacterium]MYC05521.1 type II toxin-antitoxin system HipA family toxin [Rhodothermaceae bacterium]MYE62483.1 type II toxin-antitoxin system HipA family toxin [Rhodothermaceae bacterium]MYI18136.1 type II toxin-antitoxin system HipA family toxin [Rhodothermaceae bacterium]
MMPDVSVLEVHLHGRKIATLTYVGVDRTLFAFTEEYIRDQERPLLGLGFKDSLGELITNFNSTRIRIIPWFSNLLPEGDLRHYLAKRARVNSVREFFLLWMLGQDLPGAVVVQPADGEELPPTIPYDSDHEEEVREKALRFSLAGVQLKFSAINKPGKGLTIPVRGIGGDRILKLPSRQFAALPENEYSMMELARAVGIDVPRVELIRVDMIDNLPSGIERFGTHAFVIDRFDRTPDGSLVHVEDFAQVFGVYPDHKYDKASIRNIANVIGVEGQQTDIEELIRRLVFNVLIGNADMHLKNWSLIYRDELNASLAPAYDFVSTICYIPDESFALKFSRSKRFAEFSQNELSHLAGKARLPEKLVLDVATETVAKFHEVWRAEKYNLALSNNMIKVIDKHLTRMPIAAG